MSESRGPENRITELAEAKDIRAYRFSRSKIREVFALHGAGTKHEIARAIVGDFQELASRLPPPRKCYMSEDSRMRGEMLFSDL